LPNVDYNRTYMNVCLCVRSNMQGSTAKFQLHFHSVRVLFTQHRLKMVHQFITCHYTDPL